MTKFSLTVTQLEGAGYRSESKKWESPEIMFEVILNWNITLKSLRIYERNLIILNWNITLKSLRIYERNLIIFKR